MLKIVLFITLSWAAFYTTTVTACSCRYGGEFKEYASKRGGVIRAKITSYGPKLSHGKTLYESMVVEITDVIKGNYSVKSLTLLGDPGHLCRAYVNSERFAIGTEHFFSVNTQESSVQPLGGCGESSVVIKGEFVEGIKRTNDGYQSYTLKIPDLIKSIQSQ